MTFRSLCKSRVKVLDAEAVALRQRLLGGATVVNDGQDSAERLRARAEFCEFMAAEYRSLLLLS